MGPPSARNVTPMLEALLPWRTSSRAAAIALLPADRAQFAQLAEARNATVAKIGNIEAQVKAQAANRSASPRDLALWTESLLAGREAEILQLAAEGRRQQEALSDFAKARGFTSPERMAAVCGLPSPTPRRA